MDYYYDVAVPAAKSAIIRFGLFRLLNSADLEDITQAAAIGVWRAEQRGRTDRRYQFGAARREAMKYIARCHVGHNPYALALTDDQPAPAVATERQPLPETVTAALWNLFYRARSKRGERGEAAADRDTAIVYLVASGCTDAVIAEKLGITIKAVRTYRSRIRALLLQEGAARD